MPPPKQGDYAYLLHIIKSLKANGKAANTHGIFTAHDGMIWFNVNLRSKDPGSVKLARLDPTTGKVDLFTPPEGTKSATIHVAEDGQVEDYDLWCRFTERGLRGVFLPELLCEYRVHGSSRSYTTQNYDTVMAEMSLRHPRVVKPPRPTSQSSDLS